jgi:hypothetical protein
MHLKTREEFVKLIEINKYKVGVEIGVRDGWYSEFILKNTHFDEYYAIDSYEKSPSEGSSECNKQEAYKKLKNFANCNFIYETSTLAALRFDDLSVDWCYIDAAHEYKYVKEDINTWYPKISIGGILSGHDYCRDAWPGVVDAVEEFCKENKLILFVTGIGSHYGEDGDGRRPSWWIVKP